MKKQTHPAKGLPAKGSQTSAATRSKETQPTRATKLFKLVASKGGKIIFDQRIDAVSPREAREKMKTALGLPTLTGVVYAITEIPVDLLHELVVAKVVEFAGRTNGNSKSIDLTRVASAAASVAVAEHLRPLEQRLAALESRSSTTPASVAPSKRFDAFSRESTTPPARPTTSKPAVRKPATTKRAK
jgi:hypothetical protein